MALATAWAVALAAAWVAVLAWVVAWVVSEPAASLASMRRTLVPAKALFWHGPLDPFRCTEDSGPCEPQGDGPCRLAKAERSMDTYVWRRA